MDGQLFWSKIIAQLTDGKEIQTTRGLWFRAFVVNNNLYIDQAIDEIPSSQISKRRMITKKDFLFVYSYYEAWASGERGITQTVSKQSQNVSYIFAIIKAFQM